MNQALRVYIRKRVKYRSEHLSDLGRRERPLLENLSEILFGIFHHYIDQRSRVNLAATGVQHLHHVRMRQSRSRRPTGVERFRSHCVGRNQLDRSLLRSLPAQFSQENISTLRAAQSLQQGKSPVDYPAHPFTPNWLYGRHVNHSSVPSLKSASQKRNVILSEV